MTGIKQVQKKYSAGFRDIQLLDETHCRKIGMALWYPILMAEDPIYYLEDYLGRVAVNSPFIPERFPLIISSHGSGGHRFNQHYLGEALARYGYYYAAVQHPYNNSFNNEDEDDVANFFYRSHDLRVLLDHVQNEIPFTSIQEEGAIVVGHSYGGYTALVLAGGEPDKDMLARMYINRHNACYDFSGLSDKRVTKIILLAPGLAEVFDRDSLKNVTQPVLLVVSGQDEIIKGNDKRYRELLPKKPKYIEFKDAGHYVYLMSCPEAMKQRFPLIAQDRGLAREEVHPQLIREIINFLEGNLY